MAIRLGSISAVTRSHGSLVIRGCEFSHELTISAIGFEIRKFSMRLCSVFGSVIYGCGEYQSLDALQSLIQDLGLA